MGVWLLSGQQRHFILGFICLAIAGCWNATSVQAAEWPAKPVTIIQSFTPGATADTILRAAAKALTEKYGQPFTIEYHPGAGGAVAAQYAARAAPDGYTLMFSTSGPIALSPMMLKGIGYDTDRDFTPVIVLGELPQMIVSDPKLGFKSLQDLIDFGRKNPDKMNMGHSGPGTLSHLAATVFYARTGLKGGLISYRGAVPMVTDVTGGAISSALTIYVPQVANVSILAVVSDERISYLPNVPTAKESGLDLSAGSWMGILAPAGTPPDIVAKLNKTIDEFIASPEGRAQFTRGGMSPIGGPPEKMTELIKRERATWGPLIAKENIKPEAN